MNGQINELVFLIDKSGSMAPYTVETVDAVNQAIERQRQKKLKTSVTIALFSTKYTVLYDNVDINEVKPLTTDDFRAEGGTALLDSIGTVINGIMYRYDIFPCGKRPTNVNIIITIITDGEENASHLYDLIATRYIISHAKENYHCKFVLIGIDICSFELAKQLEIPIEHTFEVKRKANPNWSNECLTVMCEAFNDLL